MKVHMENSVKQEELLQYMKDAIEVETDLATQEQMLERSLAEIEKRKPTLELYSDPQKPALEDSECTYPLAALCFGAGFLFSIGLSDPLFLGGLALGSMGMIPGILMFLRRKKVEDINSGRLLIYNSEMQSIKEKNTKATNEHNHTKISLHI